MNTPILILIYNKYFETKKLLKILREIKPNKIYIGADGPKKNLIDINECQKTRNLINLINWKCKIKKNFFLNNQGCKLAVRQSIDWFFKNESEGIILEDDCMPNKDFFKFCKLMLKKYKNNKNIFCISGSNFCKINKNTSSYYFSKYPHCWGWATWKRAWNKNIKNLYLLDKNKYRIFLDRIHSLDLEKKYWKKIFHNVILNNFDSWAYPWTFSVWKNNGLTIIPNKNLIKNIGVGEGTTNSFFRSKNDIIKNLSFRNKIRHPGKIKINLQNDLNVFYNHYRPYNYLYPWRLRYLLILFIKNPISFLKKVIKNIL